jgi:TPR repeat protein
MKLVNNFNQMLHASDAATTSVESDKNTRKSPTIWRWAPVAVVAAVLSLAAVLGAPNKGRDEVDWLSRLANSGDDGAQLQLGLAYRDGRYGLKPDAKTGLYWLKRSAAAGNAYAEKAIGSAYANGQGIHQSTQLAEQWYRKAIRDGDRNARVLLADMLIKSGQTGDANRLLM